jgi:hypothetical protein
MAAVTPKAFWFSRAALDAVMYLFIAIASISAAVAVDFFAMRSFAGPLFVLTVLYILDLLLVSYLTALRAEDQPAAVRAFVMVIFQTVIPCLIQLVIASNIATPSLLIALHAVLSFFLPPATLPSFVIVAQYRARYNYFIYLKINSRCNRRVQPRAVGRLNFRDSFIFYFGRV